MRKQNWPRIIAEEIKNLQSTPFSWGDKDCCLAVADIIKAFTGEDLVEEFRGRYKTARGSLMALKRYGQGSIRATVDKKLPSIPVDQAGRGDIGIVKTEAGESLAILFSNQVWAMTYEGMVDLPKSSLVCTWRIE